MKTIRTTLIGSLAILIAGGATAQPEPDRPGGRRGGPGMNPEMRKKILEEFDKDGDGKLNEEERKAAREAAKARMEERRAKFIEKWDTDGDFVFDGEHANARAAQLQMYRSSEGLLQWMLGCVPLQLRLMLSLCSAKGRRRRRRG